MLGRGPWPNLVAVVIDCGTRLGDKSPGKMHEMDQSSLASLQVSSVGVWMIAHASDKFLVQVLGRDPSASLKLLRQMSRQGDPREPGRRPDDDLGKTWPEGTLRSRDHLLDLSLRLTYMIHDPGGQEENLRFKLSVNCRRRHCPPILCLCEQTLQVLGCPRNLCGWLFRSITPEPHPPASKVSSE